ncbi:MAG: hypothetical protein NT138_12830 [Planctomycetales bacterium]|nr:hypothetical protein [Planctomycetales bacterium]
MALKFRLIDRAARTKRETQQNVRATRTGKEWHRVTIFRSKRRGNQQKRLVGVAILLVSRRCFHPRERHVDFVAPCAHLFTAQPEAPAFLLAGASGWAVNGEINTMPDGWPAMFEVHSRATCASEELR